MNKIAIAKILATLLALVMVSSVLVGCPNKKTVETTAPQICETTEETEVVYTTGPGVDLNDFVDSDFEDPDESETAATEETKDPTQETTKPTESTEETTASIWPNEGSTESNPAAEDFEWYNNLSGAEQKAHMDSFESVEDFFAWYNAAKSAYEAMYPDVEIGDGSVDLGDFSN